jgi:hypothetical protein|tara:strand:+ start:383 stop:583 length:201 start_codon:yes stop_codon:yes gene_type:complete
LNFRTWFQRQHFSFNFKAPLKIADRSTSDRAAELPKSGAEAYVKVVARPEEVKLDERTPPDKQTQV